MNKRASTELIVLGLIAVIAVVGLVLLFSGGTGKAAGQPMTREVLVTPVDTWGIEQPGGYTCECTGRCVYSQETVSATTAITTQQSKSISSCTSILERRCDPQPLENFNYRCTTR